MKGYWLALIFCFFAIFGCQRSTGYRQDQEYYHDSSTSYYNSKAKSPTQRLEALGQPKKRAIVLSFWNDTPAKQADIGSFAADELKRGLALTQKLIIPEDLKSDLGTADLVDTAHGDRIKVAQLIREGRRLGVSILVIGRLSKIIFRQSGDDIGIFRQKQSSAAVDVEMKLFDVSGGREIMATSRSGEASDHSILAFESQNLESPEYRAEITRLAVRNAVALLIPDVVKAAEKMTWEGRIAKLQGTRVYVNAGRSSGLIAGDILRVLAPGDDIYDPATGAFLGHSQGQLKGTLEVVDFLGTDGAITDIHTGGNFAEGDLVRLY